MNIALYEGPLEDEGEGERIHRWTPWRCGGKGAKLRLPGTQFNRKYSNLIFGLKMEQFTDVQ